MGRGFRPRLLCGCAAAAPVRVLPVVALLPRPGCVILGLLLGRRAPRGARACTPSLSGLCTRCSPFCPQVVRFPASLQHPYASQESPLPTPHPRSVPTRSPNTAVGRVAAPPVSPLPMGAAQWPLCRLCPRRAVSSVSQTRPRLVVPYAGSCTGSSGPPALDPAPPSVLSVSVSGLRSMGLPLPPACPSSNS